MPKIIKGETINSQKSQIIISISNTYQKILSHRIICPKWGKEFCIDCFGGGLMKYSKELFEDFDIIGKLLEKIKNE